MVLVVTRIDPLFVPQVVGIATAVAVIPFEAPTVTPAVTKQPVVPSVTVTKYLPDAKFIGLFPVTPITLQVNTGKDAFVVTRIDPLFFPHVVGVAKIVAVILFEVPTIVLAIAEQPVKPSVTVTV